MEGVEERAHRRRARNFRRFQPVLRKRPRGSSNVSQLVPLSSSQTNAFSGRSRPRAPGLHHRRAAAGEPNTSSTVGGSAGRRLGAGRMSIRAEIMTPAR